MELVIFTSLPLELVLYSPSIQGVEPHLVPVFLSLLLCYKVDEVRIQYISVDQCVPVTHYDNNLHWYVSCDHLKHLHHAQYHPPV